MISTETLQFLRHVVSTLTVSAAAPDFDETARLVSNSIKELDQEVAERTGETPE